MTTLYIYSLHFFFNGHAIEGYTNKDKYIIEFKGIQEGQMHIITI
jgi:hypothetical protein